MLDSYDSIEFDTIEYLATSGGLGCADSDARITYYGNNGLPHTLFNGGNMLVGGSTDMINGSVFHPIVQSMLDDATPLKMTISSFSFGAMDGHVTVDLELEGPLANLSTTKFRAAILEDDLLYSGTTYHNVLRDLLHDQALTIDEAGETQQITIPFAPDAGWNVENLRLLVFVQDDSTKEIIQSCNTRPTPEYSSRYYVLGERIQIDNGPVVFGDNAFFNTGTAADTYDISIETGDLPAGWSATFAYEGSDYTNLSVTLEPGSRAIFNVTIDAATVAGGEVTFVFHSQSGQAADRRITYKVISPDVKILLVDDDGGHDYETLYFEPALDETGQTHATWDRAAAGLSSAVLENFPVVVWQCGWAFPTVDADDRAALASYLDRGGNLFITGQDIGWEMYDDGGAARTWYNNYLHADYVNDDTNMLSLQGVAGDPISDGLSMNISGGDGANNQEYPSDIDPGDASASVILTYDAYRNGGIKADTGVHKVVYLAFGYEAINNAADRAALMQGIIGWLLPTAAPVSDSLPATLSLHGNVPNPFNPMTEISFSVGSSSHVKLGVYDVKGHLVRELDQGTLAAGEHSVFFDGVDNGGRALPSGTYFCRVEGAGQSGSVKMMLVR
jgi:hypothetical protein